MSGPLRRRNRNYALTHSAAADAAFAVAASSAHLASGAGEKKMEVAHTSWHPA